ncbi:hypothetical protein GCM10010216_53550 [Streptomyces flaveolus]|nr:hypothetical protein GCM10010216_53550 [Streptomyces flaveolus]
MDVRSPASTNSSWYAWCFDHGVLHTFTHGAEPWCTAAWVPLAADTAEEAAEAKQAAYGDALSLDGLPLEEQLDVLEIRTTRA